MTKYLGLIPYQGTKEKLLPVISEYFPSKRGRFVDAFCGGLSVTLSVDGSILANDIDAQLIRTYKVMQSHPNPVHAIKHVMGLYNLDRENKDGYMQLRADYNQGKAKDPLADIQPIEGIQHYTLITHSFSNVTRYNRKGEFNATFGRRTFSENTQERIDHFKRRCLESNIEFSSVPYHHLEIRDDDFVLLDPPYAITAATYNVGWDDAEEIRFLCWLQDLVERGVKFGLSNVTHHKGRVNEHLLRFIRINPQLAVLDLNKTYCLDRSGGNNGMTREVYITNVEKE